MEIERIFKIQSVLLGLTIFAVIIAGCGQASPQSHGDPIDDSSGTPKLGDFQIYNTASTSQVVHYRVITNGSVVFNGTQSLRANTSRSERPPIEYIDTPNVTGDFSVEVKLDGQNTWEKLRPMEDGLKTIGCFVTVVEIIGPDSLEISAAGAGCEISAP